MPEVVAIKLRYNPKQLWFSTEKVSPETGDHVIVETERGLEMGLCMTDPFTVEEDDLPAPLKPVARVATEVDLDTADSHAERADTMLATFSELVKKYKLDMKPVRVEYLFGGDKAVFYFVSEERVDFRELVRDLASRFHIRVDMRQIGVRDEARMVGDLGHCGQELCCARLGGEFQPVSIRMAKEQDLPLNPVKISGVCGRLMCCLRHEFEAYKDFKGRAPKKGALVETPLGTAKVSSLDTPNEVITLRYEDGKQLDVPLGKMECDKKAGCCKVSREALESCDNAVIDLALSVFDRETTEKEIDEFADAAPSQPSRDRKPRARKSTPSSQETSKGEGAKSKNSKGRNSNNRRRSGRGGSKQGSPQSDAPQGNAQPQQGEATSGRRRRRRRASE